MEAQLIALIFAIVIGLLNMGIIIVKQFGKKAKNNPYPCQKHERKIDKLDDDIGKLQVSMASLGASFKAFKDDNIEEHRRLFRKLNSSGG